MTKTVATNYNSTWQNRADLCIAQGALTNSKRPECFVKGIYPTHLTRGRGCHVWDTDGKKYVDFICGLGANILGYGHDEVQSEIAQRALNGSALSLSTNLEVLVAEKVKEIFPFIDLVRFLKTGSDACSAAVRIARAKTGREVVLSEGYHGWHDGFVSLTPPATGVPRNQAISTLSPAEIDLTPIAAVIVEPIMLDNSKERIQWLQRLRERCTNSSTILIFDEVITGFRYPKFGATNYHGVTPDLICLGKAMGNGAPISVVGGKTDIMNTPDYFVSSTFAGDTMALGAALKTMSLLQTKYELQYLWEKGGRFLELFNAMYPEKLKIAGYPTRGAFQGDELTKALFWQEACRAGILFGPSWFFNFEHIEVMDQVLNTCRDIFTRIRTGFVKLQGEMPKKPFAAQMRKQ